MCNIFKIIPCPFAITNKPKQKHNVLSHILIDLQTARTQKTNASVFSKTQTDYADGSNKIKCVDVDILHVYSGSSDYE